MLQQYGETWIVKISDFHRSKMTKERNQGNIIKEVSVSKEAYGTKGWRSHELCEVVRKRDADPDVLLSVVSVTVFYDV